MNSNTEACKIKWWDTVIVDDTNYSAKILPKHVPLQNKSSRKTTEWQRNVLKWDSKCLLSEENMDKSCHQRKGEKNWWSSCEEYGRRLSETIYREKDCDRDIIFSIQCRWNICCFWFCSSLFKLLALGHVAASYFREDKMKTNV